MRHRIALLMKTVGLIGFVLSLLLFAGGRPSQAAEPIKIGSIFSITGWAGALGTPPKEAIEIVVDEVNRKGGVLGRQIEIAYEDDQSNPTNSAIAATKLIGDRKVSVLLGSTLTVLFEPLM
jgi:branched-chain amino acid transport system substrate-binding protein